MKKLFTLAVFGAGYVLGTKAGRERYEDIKRTFNKVKNNPRVQGQAQHAADLAREKAPLVKEKFSEGAGAAVSKVKGDQPDPASHMSRDQAESLNRDSTIFEKDPYPQGTLP